MSREKSRREEIFKKYSKLFGKKRGDDARRWPIFYGFEHDDGWLCIVEELCEMIQFHTDRKRASDPKFPQPEILQCKEKFGTLRFYISGGDDYINGLIAFAEKSSARTCERCGGIGKSQKGAWIKVLCDPCNKIRNDEIEDRNKQWEEEKIKQLRELQKNEQS